MTAALQPLAGVRVLDFSTLLPGPLCSLLLAEAGAEVIKVEKPEGGDIMRSYEPRFGDTSVNFALLNRGKRSLALDLRHPDDLQRALDEVRHSDILIEQFRPGVMERLGLDYERLRALKPDLIYCSITGYGAQGPLAKHAAHAPARIRSLCRAYRERRPQRPAGHRIAPRHDRRETTCPANPSAARQ